MDGEMPDQREGTGVAEEALLSPVTGEFRDPALERAYEEDAWPRLGRQVRLVLSVAGLLYLGALYLNHLKLGLGSAFWIMAGLRMGVGILLGGCLLASGRPSPRFRGLLLLSFLLIGVTELVETHLSQGWGQTAGMPFVLVMIVMAYVMVPNRVWMTLLGSGMVSLLFLGYQALRAGWGAPDTLLMLLSLLMANGTGYAFQWSWNRLVRRDFALRRTLVREVGERRRAEEEARMANAAKSRFLAVMSHEIRTPLNGVLGGVQLLQGTELREDQRKPLEIVAHSGNQLALLLDEVLDLTRIEAGRLKLMEEPFDPMDLLASIHAVLYPQAKAKGLDLRMESPREEPPVLVGDALRLRQVLLNLVGNAVKFTPRGEVVFSMERAPESGGDGWIFRVRDTGPGLEEGARERIFRPFEQEDDSIRRRHGGSGLGLTISRELVTAMGGNLGVDSAPGQGSTFHFTLDLPRAEPWTGTSPGRASSPSLRILVVDDVEANAFVAKGLLTGLGHRAETVPDGERALDLLRESAFDAVLMDLHMPDMDGMEAFRQLRALPRPWAAEVPVFLMTADTERGNLEASMAAGMAGVLPKPIRLSRLEALLAEVPCRSWGPIP